MIPYNYVDLLTLDEKNSRSLAGRKFNLGAHRGAASPGASNDRGHAPASPVKQRRQIQVNSTIDADIGEGVF